MSNFGGLSFTTKGRNLQAKAEAGAALNFTKIKIGSGELGGQSIATLSNLITTEKTLSITKCKALTSGYAAIGTSFNNSEQTTGFYWREVGLFATDPDLGEILYCYGNSGDDAEYIPASGTDIVEKSVDVVAIIGNATSVTATIEQSLVFALLSELEAEAAAREDADAGLQVNIGIEALARANADTALENIIRSHTEDMDNPHGVTASQIGAVPTTRTVNGHALSANVSITASDVGLGNVQNVAQMPLAGGTFTGICYPQVNTSYTAGQARRIRLYADGTTIPTLSNGEIAFTYI